MASPKVKVSDAIDLIDVTLTTAAATMGNNEAITLSIEIPNAVASVGGSSIIQSITLFNLSVKSDLLSKLLGSISW